MTEQHMPVGRQSRLERLWRRRRNDRARWLWRAATATLAIIALLVVTLWPAAPVVDVATSTGQAGLATSSATGFTQAVMSVLERRGIPTAAAAPAKTRVTIKIVDPGTENGGLSVDDVVKRVLQRNPEVRAADARVEQADAAMTLGAQASGAAQDALAADPTNEELAQAALQAQQNLIDAAGAVTLAESASDYTQALMAYMARAAFYGVLEVNDLTDVAQQGLDQAEKQLELAKTQLEVGVVARRDVVAAESQVAEMKTNLLSAQKGLQLAALNLNRMMGWSRLTRDIVLARDNSAVPSIDMTDDAQSETLESALDDRMDVVQARSRRNTADEKLDLLADYHLDNSPMADILSAQHDEAEAQLDSAHATAEYEVRQLYLDLGELQQKRELAQKKHEYAQDLARLAELRFENGLSTALEANAAQTGLLQAQAQLVQSRYDLLLARQRLVLVKKGPLPSGSTSGASSMSTSSPSSSGSGGSTPSGAAGTR